LSSTWVVLKNSSRPTFRDQDQDQDQQCQDQDQDRKKSVSSGLETKTVASRTTRLKTVNFWWIQGLHCVQKKTPTHIFFHISMNYLWI